MNRRISSSLRNARRGISRLKRGATSPGASGLLDEFINLDKKLHANWDTYDHYVTKAESAANTETNESEEEQTKETEISQSSTDQLAEQPEDATPSKPKSKSKSKK